MFHNHNFDRRMPRPPYEPSASVQHDFNVWLRKMRNATLSAVAISLVFWTLFGWVISKAV